MSVLIVGGDRIGKIKEQLHKKGFTDIDHITGRKKGETKEWILLRAQRADMVIVFIDFISHSTVINLKNNAKQSNIIFSKRSWSFMQNHIDSFMVGKN
jgi:hypothetical protein